jgi:hypothetical protein
MRCPACGSDTSPALPNCTQCNAVLDPPPPGEGVVFPDDASASPGGETVTSLSPEPWNVQQPLSRYPPPVQYPDQQPGRQPGRGSFPDPFQEPAIWQPPAPRQRSPLPYVLAGAGVVLLMAVALAIIFWPSSSSAPPPPAVPGQSSGAAPGTGEQNSPAGDSSAPALNQQAGQVDALLTEMAGTRAELASAVTGGCQIGALESVRSQRQEQLAKARELQVDALENGTAMRDALVRALEAAVASNQRYLDVAPGCPTDDMVSAENARATQAKSEFVEYWRPNAEKAGLQVRSAADI